MFVGDLEEIVTIKFTQRRCHPIEHKIDKFAPPTFVVIFARSIDGGAGRHLFPSREKRAIELLRIESQVDLTSDQRIMVADRLGEIKERANRVEKDRLGHVDETSNAQRSTSNTE
jgi:hypothetical protein